MVAEMDKSSAAWMDEIVVGRKGVHWAGQWDRWMDGKMVCELVAEKDGGLDCWWGRRCPAGKAQRSASWKARKLDGR